MDYKKLNDNELVYLCCDNNEDAINIIVEKYKPHILKILKELLKEYNIIGYEVSDLFVKDDGVLNVLYIKYSI